MKLCGIYLIRNAINGKCYVGLSTDIKARFKHHRRHAGRLSTTISMALFKHGLNSFEFTILEECQPCELNAREVCWIAKLSPAYNQTPGGFGVRTHSAKTLTLLSEAGKRQWRNKTEAEKELFAKNNLTGPPRGRAVSQRARNKISEALSGRKLPQLHRDKIGASNRVAMIGNHSGDKPVVQIASGTPLKSFPSVKLAARAVGVHPSNLTKVLKGRQNTAGGFSWAYQSPTSTNK